MSKKWTGVKCKISALLVIGGIFRPLIWTSQSECKCLRTFLLWAPVKLWHWKETMLCNTNTSEYRIKSNITCPSELRNVQFKVYIPQPAEPADPPSEGCLWSSEPASAAASLSAEPPSPAWPLYQTPDHCWTWACIKQGQVVYSRPLRSN